MRTVRGLFLFLVVLGPVALSQSTEATVRIKTDVPGVSVFRGGEEVGRTPLILRESGSRKVVMRFVKPDFEDVEKQVEFEAGKSTTLFLVMRRITTPLPELPIRFLGVHEHAKSRCKGTLTVHADRLTYQSEGPDKFDIPFRSITFLSRSTGPLFVVPWAVPIGGGAAMGGAAGIERVNPGQVLPVRVETKDRKYGFWVYEEGGEASSKTNELYSLLSRLVALASAPSPKQEQPR